MMGGNNDNANLANNDFMGPWANKSDAAEAKVALSKDEVQQLAEYKY